MLTDRRMLIMIISLFLGFVVVLCVLGYARITSFLNIMEVSGEGQAPIRSLRVTINTNHREQLFRQFQEFAEKHGFEYQITDFEGKGENFQYWMSRDDITIIASNPFELTEFRIRFYPKYPGYSVDEEVLHDLVDDLIAFINEIPNVEIMEEN